MKAELKVNDCLVVIDTELKLVIVEGVNYYANETEVIQRLREDNMTLLSALNEHQQTVRHMEQKLDEAKSFFEGIKNETIEYKYPDQEVFITINKQI